MENNHKKFNRIAIILRGEMYNSNIKFNKKKHFNFNSDKKYYCKNFKNYYNSLETALIRNNEDLITDLFFATYTNNNIQKNQSHHSIISFLAS